MSSALPPTLAALLLAASTASAAITIDTVKVEDPGRTDPATGYGKIHYVYRIGTYEVTNGQYTAFLNAVAKTDTHELYNSFMDRPPSGGITQVGSQGNYSYHTKPNMEDKPVNYVSFWDAARFANWLTNGQPTGPQGPSTTEDGMYNLRGVTDPDNSMVTRQLDFSAGENGVAVASDGEWYKAAYYDGSGRYYLYPTQTNYAPPKATANETGYVNNPQVKPANYGLEANWNNSLSGNVTTVGSADAPSHYGTFDQGGNVDEWVDDILFTTSRGLRGGSYISGGSIDLKSTLRSFGAPADADWNGHIGFRVTSLTPISESSQ